MSKIYVPSLYSDIEFHNGVGTIPMETLGKSAELTDMNGNLPKSAPFSRLELIESVGDLWSKQNVSPQSEIIIYDKYTNKVAWKDKKDPDVPIQNLLFKRFIGKLTVPVNDLHNATVAFVQSERGVQVGYGLDVQICSNMSILGGKVLTTFGKNKSNPKDILSTVSQWLKQWEKEFQLYENYINEMAKVVYNEEDILKFIGALKVNSTQHNYNIHRGVGNDHPLVLNSTQVTRFTEEFLEHERPDADLWEIYNWGTQVLHPKNSSDPTSIMTQNSNWIEYVKEYTDLELN